MKFTKKSNSTLSAIRRAMTSGTALGSLLVGLTAQSNAAQESDCEGLGGVMPAMTNSANEAKGNQPVLMGKMRITLRPVAGAPAAPTRGLPLPE